MHARCIVNKTPHDFGTIEKWALSHKPYLPTGICQIDYELQAIIDHFGNLAKRHKIDQITGAIVVIDNGDYAHIWITWSSCPYDILAKYYKAHIRLY